jgi:thymidylate synthase
LKAFSHDHFETIVNRIRGEFLENGENVEVGEWQSFREESPMNTTFEVQDISFEWYYVPQTVSDLQNAVKPNLPWAEDHFKERVSGDPLNPGVEYKNWPWYKQGVENHKPGGQFSHTYMERYWPKYLEGIRFPAGDLHNLETMMRERPHTRQAYLPVWFPEDLWAADQAGERVPCTLGYHFLYREEEMKVVYYMRSCDWFRYFRDDVYLTSRLLQRVAAIVGAKRLRLVMHISSLHIFAVERERLWKEEHAY